MFRIALLPEARGQDCRSSWRHVTATPVIRPLRGFPLELGKNTDGCGLHQAAIHRACSNLFVCQSEKASRGPSSVCGRWQVGEAYSSTCSVSRQSWRERNGAPQANLREARELSQPHLPHKLFPTLRSSSSETLLGIPDLNFGPLPIMAAANRPRVFLDVSIGEEPAGRLTIELFADKTPKTAEK